MSDIVDAGLPPRPEVQDGKVTLTHFFSNEFEVTCAETSHERL